MSEVVLEALKCYEVQYKIDPRRKNAKLLTRKFQVLQITPDLGKTLIITNSRPWNEGRTGQIYLHQIVSAKEIPRGPHDR